MDKQPVGKYTFTDPGPFSEFQANMVEKPLPSLSNPKKHRLYDSAISIRKDKFLTEREAKRLRFMKTGPVYSNRFLIDLSENYEWIINLLNIHNAEIACPFIFVGAHKGRHISGLDAMDCYDYDSFEDGCEPIFDESQELFKALGALTNIKKLNIPGLPGLFTDYMGDGYGGLTSIDLIYDSYYSFFTKYFPQLIEKCPKIEDLSITVSLSSDESDYAFSGSLSELKYLRVEYQNKGKKTAFPLTFLKSLFEVAPALQVLDISKMPISLTDLQQLPENAKIESLKLGEYAELIGNKDQEAGKKKVIEALKTIFPNLQESNISFRKLTFEEMFTDFSLSNITF